MRLSNRTKAPIYNFVNTLLIIFFIVGVAGFFMDKNVLKSFGNYRYLLIILPIIMLLIFHLMGRQIFEYDSDGEALNFKNRNILPFLKRSASDEFPKYKLLKYDVMNILGVKRLYVTVSSKKMHSTILKYDVSFLNQKEINDLKHSLEKVVNRNKKEGFAHNNEA